MSEANVEEKYMQVDSIWNCGQRREKKFECYNYDEIFTFNVKQPN